MTIVDLLCLVPKCLEIKNPDFVTFPQMNIMEYILKILLWVNPLSLNDIYLVLIKYLNILVLQKLYKINSRCIP